MSVWVSVSISAIAMADGGRARCLHLPSDVWYEYTQLWAEDLYARSFQGGAASHENHSNGRNR